MTQYSTNKHMQYPAVVDDVVILPPSPERLDTEPTPQNVQAGLLVVMSANLAVMVIVMVGLWAGGMEPLTIILSGIGYFTVTTPLYLALVTNVVTNMYSRHERETTERLKIEAWRELGAMHMDVKLAVEETRQLELLGRRGGADPVQRVSPLNTYVPAIAQGEEAQAEGARFAMSLYATNGKPDPHKLHPDGRLAGRMIGSKRGSGSREAGLWLLRERIVEKVPGGYRLNIRDYPTRDSLRHYL